MPGMGAPPRVSVIQLSSLTCTIVINLLALGTSMQARADNPGARSAAQKPFESPTDPSDTCNNSNADRTGCPASDSPPASHNHGLTHPPPQHPLALHPSQHPSEDHRSPTPTPTPVAKVEVCPLLDIAEGAGGALNQSEAISPLVTLAELEVGGGSNNTLGACQASRFHSATELCTLALEHVLGIMQREDVWKVGVQSWSDAARLCAMHRGMRPKSVVDLSVRCPPISDSRVAVYQCLVFKLK